MVWIDGTGAPSATKACGSSEPMLTARSGLSTAGAADGVVEIVTQPADWASLSIGVGGLPDFHRAEMRPAGLRIPAAVDDRQLAGIETVS